MTRDDGWLVCPRTEAALQQLDEALQRVAGAEDPHLREMARYLITRGGKRLRPALLFLTASYGSGSVSTLLEAATALELIHVASLYHDDIMDRAPLRRGTASANARWGNSGASIAGTYLFARASAVLASLGEAPNTLAAEAAVDLCTGQLQEVENAYNLGLTVDDHLHILARKTATLFVLPCRLGCALSPGAAEHEVALAAYGRHLGMAFQITDDALDLAGDSASMGKATATDLREGVYSLPILCVLRRGGTPAATVRSVFEKAHLTPADVEQVLGVAVESGAVAESIEVARGEAREAQSALAALPDTPARRSLFRLTEHVLARSA